jgi:large subunit ribosomal protein L10
MGEKSVNPKKLEAVNIIKENLQDAKAIILVDYKGINVKEDTELRRLFRAHNVKYFVCKNTLLKFAANDLQLEGLDEFLAGATAVAVSKEDEIIPAKLIDNFVKSLPKEKRLMRFKAGIIDDRIMSFEELNRIITLPPRQELLAKLIGGLNSPIAGLVFTLNGILQKLVLVLNEIKNQKEIQ